MLRYLTAGESHGKGLIAILEGMPSNLPLSAKDVDVDLARRQEGPGRGGRMKIEKDKVDFISGVRHGKTLGSPIGIFIPNKDFKNWTEIMSAEKGSAGEKVTKLRPGHADLAGILKYGFDDVRNVLERASARETAARVAVGAVCKKFLSEFGIKINSKVVHVGGAEGEKEIKALIEKIKAEGDTLGGVFEVTAAGVPAGLGSYVQWDRKLDGRISQAIMSIPAIKGVEIGLGFENSGRKGSAVHDEIFYDEKGYGHKTNNAGGLEGGVTNGEDIVIRAAMKPISTLLKPLKSVDLKTKKSAQAHVERSDVAAVEAAAVVGEAGLAYELARVMLEKFGHDSLPDIKAAFQSYLKRIR
ncbi:MAG: chorismate synthase [Candidatus Margulisbacteria bacterium]|nr:chorismate synthase [Candidatus Margulisiibacteriota bacterium]MBU1021747.1 chorismate synthase [Candidatus Margulisiibacteriota bacterium]MBU1729493.1 chorismate synthase [Candidatus Margulisiibacteriota bacterium]MBU1955406.1 chorismate synthase [Candidatus Margulisiibacteriota bacterium]